MLYNLGQQLATPEQFFQFVLGVSTVPEQVDRNALDAALRRASGVIRRRVRLGHYGIGADGFPTDAAVKQAFANATCAQLAYWGGPDDEGQIDGDAISGASSNWDSVTMAGVTLARRVGSAAANASAADQRIAPEALELLMESGVFTTQVASPGYFPGRVR